jgi:beta-glucosidase
VFDGNTLLFPFGFGLSYTTFSFGKPTLNRDRISPDDTTKVWISVTNTGTRAGDEVVQMYIHHQVSSIVQPVEVLRGFKRIHLETGASAKVSFDIGPEQISILNAEMRQIVEPGAIDVMIGSSSAETSNIQLVVNKRSTLTED